VVLHLDEEVLRTQDGPIVVRRLPGCLLVAFTQPLEHFPAQAGAGADEALRVLGQQRLVDAGLVVVAVQVRLGGQRHQVLVADGVLGQQDHVVRVGVDLRFLVRVGAGRHVGLDAHDRLDARRSAGLVERDRPVHRAVVREAEGAHAQVGGSLRHRAEPAQAVEQAEFRVDVKVDEVVRGQNLGSQGHAVDGNH
jgi:hypothetical protein